MSEAVSKQGAAKHAWGGGGGGVGDLGDFCRFMTTLPWLFENEGLLARWLLNQHMHWARTACKVNAALWQCPATLLVETRTWHAPVLGTEPFPVAQL